MSDVRRVNEAFNDAFNAHDFERMRELTAEDAMFTAPGDVRLEGRDAIMEYAQSWLDAFSDGRVEVERDIVSGDWLVEQYTFHGTHSDTLRGPTGDIPATGRKVKGRVVGVHRIEDGVIAESHLYFDQVEVLTQLGLMPELARA
jgi:steroid delta-isomerase-like uncharacterized protein